MTSRPALRRYFQAGVALQLLFVTVIATLAYRGNIPTELHLFAQADWLGHAVLIGLLGFFLDGALGYQPISQKIPWLRLGPAIVIFLAAIEEIAQRLSPNRSSSLSDFIADVAGVIILSWASKQLYEKLATA